MEKKFDYIQIWIMIDDGTFRNSQRGDSGSIIINTICIRAGTTAAPNIHLHVPGAWNNDHQTIKVYDISLDQ